MRLEKYVVETLKSDDNNNVEMGTIEFVHSDNLSSSFFSDANCVILNSDFLSDECMQYFVNHISQSNASLAVICKSQREFHQCILNTKAQDDREGEEKVYSLVVKDFGLTKNNGDPGISSGIGFVVLSGSFEIKNPPLKMFYEGLSHCLGEIVQQITPQVHVGHPFTINIFN